MVRLLRFAADASQLPGMTFNEPEHHACVTTGILGMPSGEFLYGDKLVDTLHNKSKAGCVRIVQNASFASFKASSVA